MECISYKKGYKYQLVEGYTTVIPITPSEDIVSTSDFIKLTSEGKLILKKGYAWDGASGPAIDTLNFMRGSLVHDALYQLMREKLLNKDTHRDRDTADKLLKKMCKEDGMSSLRAWWVHKGVQKFGDPAANPYNKKKVIKAPKSCR